MATPGLLGGIRRRLAAAVAAGCALVVLLLGVVVHGESRGTAVDAAIDPVLRHDVPVRVLRASLHMTDPRTDVVLVAVVAVVAALRRRWSLLVVVVIAPSLALLLTEAVLKPLVHRTVQGLLAYPSGHQSVPACLATILALVVLRSGWHAAAKVVALAGLLGYVLGCAVGLVGVFYHYATDVVGAICLSVACVLATALVADRQLT